MAKSRLANLPVALSREIAEELGLQVEVGQLLGSGSAAAGSRLIALDV